MVAFYYLCGPFLSKLDMTFLEISLLAIGLSMDTLAVSITGGTLPCITRRKGLRLSIVFGIFHGLMPLLGWFTGLAFKSLIEHIDHWIAFGIFLLIGGKMIFEAIKTKEKEFNINNWIVMVGLAIATSIDAFIVGVSLCFLDINIWLTVTVIVIVSFLCSFSGIYIGKTNKWLSPKIAEIAGGIVLIVIGIKVLVEHNALQL